MPDRLVFRIIAQLDGHFAPEDVWPADVDRWKELKRQLIRMRDGLLLVLTTLREERARGIPLSDETARRLEQYAAFGLGKAKNWDRLPETTGEEQGPPPFRPGSS